jgi:hypothetical protein
MKVHSVGLANFLAEAYKTPKNRTSPILIAAERKIPISSQRNRVKGLASYAGFVTKMSEMLRQNKNKNHNDNDPELIFSYPFSPRSNATMLEQIP